MDDEDIVLETERLVLRKMTQADYSDLCEILQDAETMYAYEHAFSDEEVRQWLDRQLRRYHDDGFGLWAMIEKSSGEFVGQCGLTIQDCAGERVVEIGYLLKRRFWHLGFATEAAIGCKRYAFDILRLPAVYSIIRDNNVPSQQVALRNGMHQVKAFVKHYHGMDMPHLVFLVENPRE